MRNQLSITKVPLAVLSLGFLAAACTVEDLTVNIPNATVNATANVDVENVMPEQIIPVMLNVTNVYLIEPTMTPPVEHKDDAGHVRIYLDDVATPPLVITAMVNVDVKIPPATKAGKHKLICRVHKHDGKPTDTKFEVDITVKVTVGGGTGGAGGSSAGTGGAGGASTGTGGAGGAGVGVGGAGGAA